jgi:hypothetical protein
MWRYLAGACLAVALVDVKPVWADLPIRDAATLKAQGFKALIRQPKTKKSRPEPQFQAGTLAWPVQFESAEHSMGNTMIQFQRYSGGKAYFHGGCDLRTQAGEAVFAPQSGRLEAGHYAYTVGDDGSLEKFFKPWPETGEDLYFEVAIVDDQGFRFEFHHVDRKSLPPSIVDRLNSSFNPIVQKGELLGRVVAWPVNGAGGRPYHHIHYNIIDPQGTKLNPEHYSAALTDPTPPVIHGVYAKNSITQLYDPVEQFLPMGAEVVVATTDQRLPNVYTHTPPLVQWKWPVGNNVWGLVGWNFLQQLSNTDGSSPDIRRVFINEIRTSLGQRLVTRGDYQQNFFLFQMPLPNPLDSHELDLVVQDQAGNQTSRSFLVR